MTRKKIMILSASLIVLAVLAMLVVFGTVSTQKTNKYYEVQKGPFEAVLTCKGEINGLVATEIKAPPILGDHTLRLWSMKILDLAPDGKTVKKGEFLLQLDASQVMAGMREEQQNNERYLADLNNAKIDSAVKLTQMREDIKNARLDLEYNKIDLEQSVYESEAYQRKAQMNYQKAENAIAKKQRDYMLEQNRRKTWVSRYVDQLERSNERIEKFKEAMQAARITAPEDGIVIFGKSWDGKKFSKDDNISTHMYAPPIATLPDMSKVISEIYVKEIDIAKIEVGDSVRVSFDALDGLQINGSIKNIARVGEDHKDFDMKVFKVIIHLDHTDEGLKPAMTSNNEIILTRHQSAIAVPINTIFSENGTKYVYLMAPEGARKQEVTTGLNNEKFVLVESGLKVGDKVLLEEPEVVIAGL